MDEATLDPTKPLPAIVLEGDHVEEEPLEKTPIVAVKLEDGSEEHVEEEHVDDADHAEEIHTDDADHAEEEHVDGEAEETPADAAAADVAGDPPAPVGDVSGAADGVHLSPEVAAAAVGQDVDPNHGTLDSVNEPIVPAKTVVDPVDQKPLATAADPDQLYDPSFDPDPIGLKDRDNSNENTKSQSPPRPPAGILSELDMRWSELKHFVHRVEGDVDADKYPQLSALLAFVRSQG